MSVLKLSVVKSSDSRLAAKDNRFSVVLNLEFFNEVETAVFQPRPEGAKRIDKKNWQTTVYVKDKDEFAKFVEWKSQDTQEQWDRYAEVVERI